MLLAAVIKPNPRPGNEILDGAGDEHLPRGGEGSDARRDVDRDPPDVLLHQLDLAAMEADAHLQAEGAARLDSIREGLGLPSPSATPAVEPSKKAPSDGP